MKKTNLFFIMLVMLILSINTANAQDADNKVKLSGELLTDQRFLLDDPNEWAWNENRLTLMLDKKVSGNSKFHSEVWLRNIGLPQINNSANLYNKGIMDPYNLEVREAYVQLYQTSLVNIMLFFNMRQNDIRTCLIFKTLKIT